MGAKHHEEIVAWQLANELQCAIFEATARGAASQDFKFCNQIRGASSSVSANIAEGFWRYTHREFARFLRIARGSLGEAQNHLRTAKQRGYLTEAEFRSLCRLSVRAFVATTRLMTYLRNNPDPRDS